MGLGVRKPVFVGLQKTKVQTSLGIHTVWLVSLLIAFWKLSYLKFATSKISIFKLVFARAEENDFSLALLDTLTTGFVTWRPMCGSRGVERGSLGPPPPPPRKNYKNIGFLSNTGPDFLKLTNHKATKPAFNIWPSSARQ